MYVTRRVDYALEYKGLCVGVVEVKTPKTLRPDSVAKLLLPLMKLQAKNRDSRMAYLGILTDGYRYVFATLQGEKFIFENANSVDDPRIKIHMPQKWGDLNELMKYIHSILDYNIGLLTTFSTSSYYHGHDF